MYRRCLTLILLFAVACIGWGPATIYVKPASGDDYADITLFWTAESLTMNGDDCYGAGDDTWSATGATIDDGNPKVGTYALLANADNEYVVLQDAVTEVCDGAKGRIGFWYYRTANPDTDLCVFRLQVDASNEIYFQDTSADDEFEVAWEYDEAYQVYWATTGVDLPNTTYVFIEFAYDATVGDGSDYLKVYKNGSLIDSTTTETLTDIGTVDNVLVGALGNHNQAVTNVDNIMCSTDPTRNLYAIALNTTCPK